MANFLPDRSPVSLGLEATSSAIDHQHRQLRQSRHPLIICASLVENPMNLGALCRTAEVLGIESLVLSQLKLARSREFRKLAVSADQWQPLEACPLENLSHWLAIKEQSGYIPLALTPDSDACPLPRFRFPKCSLLVLGRELTGIPQTVLAQCRAAIAIPQYGQVESLNVQTAAAIAIYEYLRQHSLVPSEED